MAQTNDYWRGGWARGPMANLPGTTAAAMNGGNYGPLNAVADIIGAVMERNKQRGEQKAMEALYSPVDVNTSEVVSTPQFQGMTMQDAMNQYTQPQTPQQQAAAEFAPMGGVQAQAGGMANDLSRVGMTGAAQAMQNFQKAAPAQFGSNAWGQQNIQPSPQSNPQNSPQPQSMQQVASQQSGEAPGQYTPPVPQQSQGDALEAGFSNHDGVTMDNGRVGCAEAVGKIGSYFSPFYKQMADNKVYWVPTMLQEAQNAGYRIEQYNPETVQRGDGIIYGDGEHVMIADGNGGAYGNSSNALGPDGPGAVVHGGNLADYGQPTLVIKTSQDLQGMQGQGQPQQMPQGQGRPIQMPQTQRYRPERPQLHQATEEQPWTDRYNTRERVTAAYDDAWAKKMKTIVDKAPQLLQDRSLMQQVIAMREQGKQQLLEDWQKTETRRNWDDFQTALADNDYSKALYLGAVNGLDKNTMGLLLSKDYDNQLVDLGGNYAILSQSKYGNDILLNGQPVTDGGLQKTLTEAQKYQIANSNRAFEETQRHNRAMEDISSYNAETSRMNATNRSGGGSGGSRGGGADKNIKTKFEYLKGKVKGEMENSKDVDDEGNFIGDIRSLPSYPAFEAAQREYEESIGIDPEAYQPDEPQQKSMDEILGMARQDFADGMPLSTIKKELLKDYSPEQTEEIMKVLRKEADEASRERSRKANEGYMNSFVAPAMGW